MKDDLYNEINKNRGKIDKIPDIPENKKAIDYIKKSLYEEYNDFCELGFYRSFEDFLDYKS